MTLVSYECELDLEPEETVPVGAAVDMITIAVWIGIGLVLIVAPLVMATLG